jgi:ubiquinone/menaquinone biosynthesis C-methylase UbiE
MSSWDPIWESVFKQQEWGKYPGESLIQFIARNFYKKIRKDVFLLEIGCGPGANIWYMSREGFNVTGIDGSETAINIAKERLQKEDLQADLVVGDILKLPFSDNSFDGIVDNECLYANNDENTVLILSEINRVLKTNGLFYSRTFSKEMFNDKEFENKFEFTDIDEGPLKGKGFVRLVDNNRINTLYGKLFNIVSVDKLEYTQYNSTQKISEYIIICQKS